MARPSWARAPAGRAGAPLRELEAPAGAARAPGRTRPGEISAARSPPGRRGRARR